MIKNKSLFYLFFILLFSQIIKSQSIENHFLKGTNFFLANDYKNAEAEYNLEIKENPENANAYYELGLIYTENGDEITKSKDYFSEAIKINPNFEFAYYSRGNREKELGEYKEAVQDYKKALEINPDFINALTSLASLHAEMGNNEDAIKTISKAIDLHPKSYLFYTKRGYYQENSGKYDLAILDFTKALNIKKDYKNALSSRSYCYQRIKEYQKSLDDLNKLLELKVDGSDTYNHIGITQMNLGNKTEACKNFNIAKNLGNLEAQNYLEKFCVKN